jgi:DNA-binding beta-propeller fold protein YncE
LRKSPSEALESVVQVGQQPVPIGFVDGGRYAIVGNSARFSSPSGEQTLSVINTLRAIRGEKSLMGTIQAGSFPRELSFDPASNEVLLTNFNSDNIEFIEISSLGGLRILTSPALVSVFQRIQ